MKGVLNPTFRFRNCFYPERDLTVGTGGEVIIFVQSVLGE